MTNRKSIIFAAEHRIITKGQPANAAYLVVRGLVQVYLEKHGRIVTLAELGPGAIFGEGALFGSESYGANVKALQETELTLITPESFQKTFMACDPMIKAVIQAFQERQRRTNEALLKSETREHMEIDWA